MADLRIIGRAGSMMGFRSFAFVATQTLANFLGSGGANGGFNPLYQIGGPRSVQLAMKSYSDKRALRMITGQIHRWDNNMGG